MIPFGTWRSVKWRKFTEDSQQRAPEIFWFVLWNLPKIPSNVFPKYFGLCSGIYRRFPTTCSWNILASALEFTEDSQQRSPEIFWFLLWNLAKIPSNLFVKYFGFCSGIYRRLPATFSWNILVCALEFIEDSQQRAPEIFWFLLWNLPKISTNVFRKYFGYCSGILDKIFIKNVGNFLRNYTKGNIPKQDNSMAIVTKSPKSRSVSLFIAMHFSSISDWEAEKLG